MKSPSIAIVGTEGSGKTVLIAVLAKYLARPDLQATSLEPLGIETVRIVERVLTILNNSEWPPLTPPGQLPRLHWKFRLGHELRCNLQCVDAAGQDLRRLFAEEQVERTELPEPLKKVADYVRNADIVLFLVNLRDFVGESDVDRKIQNQWAIKYALDWLKEQSGSRRYCVVLTQVDQYGPYLAECRTWAEVVKRHLPQVYDFHLADGGTRIIPIAAVNETRIDPEGARRVPVPGFKSIGLEGLVEWLRQSVRSLIEESGSDDGPSFDSTSDYPIGKPTGAIDESGVHTDPPEDGKSQIESNEQQQTPPDDPIARWFREFGEWLDGKRKKGPPGAVLGVVGMVVVTLLIVILCVKGCSTLISPKISYRLELEFGVAFDDIVLHNTSAIPLTNVHVDATVVTPDGRKKYESLDAPRVAAGGVFRWPNVVTVPRGSKVSGKLRCDEAR